MNLIFLTIITLVLLVFLFFLYIYFFYEETIRNNDLLYPKSEILKTENGEIEYAVVGDGLPVLMLHGPGGGFDQGIWASRVVFKKKYKIISVSRFGFLNSPLPSNASMEKQVLLYRDLLDHLKIDKAVVVGFSTGGLSAIKFANDFKDRVSGLILLCAASVVGNDPDFWPKLSKMIYIIERDDYLYWFFSNFMVKRFTGLIGIKSQVYESFTPEQKGLLQELLDVLTPITKRNAGSLYDERTIKSLTDLPMDNISSPVLIIHSKDDGYLNFKHAKNSNEKIKNSELVLYETGGMAMIPQMEDIRKKVGEFLTRLQTLDKDVKKI